MRVVVAFLAVAFVVGHAGAAGAQSKNNDSVLCFSIGSENFKKDDYIDTGIRACTRLIAVRSGKGLAAAYGARGYWYTKQDKLDAAIADFDRAIEVDPKNVELYDYRADAWDAKGEPDKALASYETSIRVDPTYAPAHLGRGVILLKKGQIERARESFEATLAAPTKDRIGEWAKQQARKRLQKLDDDKKKN
jgi:tetratricopeptide (TPR) repeat protein